MNPLFPTLLGHSIWATNIKKPFKKKIETGNFSVSIFIFSFLAFSLVLPLGHDSSLLPWMEAFPLLSPAQASSLTLPKLASPPFTQTCLPAIPSQPRAKSSAQVHPTSRSISHPLFSELPALWPLPMITSHQMAFLIWDCGALSLLEILFPWQLHSHLLKPFCLWLGVPPSLS